MKRSQGKRFNAANSNYVVYPSCLKTLILELTGCRSLVTCVE